MTRRLLIGLQLIALAALLIALWWLRPHWPLPIALDKPLTTQTAQRLITTAGWSLAVLLGLHRLATQLRALIWPRRPEPAPKPISGRQPPRTDAIPRAVRMPLAPYRLTIRPASEAVATHDPLPGTEDLPPAAAPANTPAVRIALLGAPEIKAAKRPRRRSTIELLAYLALHPHGATRDALLEALWPGHDPRRSRPRFWQAVSEARRLLPEQALLVDRDRYQLDRSLISVDVDDLDQALNEARDAPDPIGALAALERAFSIACREPLAGSDYHWADSDIAALNATRAELIERLTRARLATGDPRGALEAAEHGLAIDELSETFARLALQAEGALGLRDAIIRRYDDLTQRLDDRLGLHPASETRSLYHQLLAQA